STRGSLANKSGVPKVSRQFALAFARRTLARCRRLEGSGTSCFSDPALQEIIFALPPKFPEMLKKEFIFFVILLAAGGGFMDMFEKNGPPSVSNRGKKKEAFLDDVGIPRTSAAATISGAKGKRSERDSISPGKNTKAGGGGGRGGAPVGGSKGERRTTKTKLKQQQQQQRTAQISSTPTSGNAAAAFPSSGGESNEDGGGGGNKKKKKDIRFVSSSAINDPSSVKDDFGDLPINDLDGMADLGVDSAAAAQDLNSWFNFDDVDGLQDHDSIGLEIPMDDLADINVF
ncbi:hypothetical protein M569_16901, partial [Genlisea aurea]